MTAKKSDKTQALRCRYWDEQTAEVVLGETLSTSVKGEGSRAASEVHAEESHTIADGDADLLSATLNQQLVRWMIELNFGAEAINLSPKVWRPRPRNEAAEEEVRIRKLVRQKAALEVLSLARREGFEPKDLPVWMREVLETEVSEVERSQKEPSPQTTKATDKDQAFAEEDDLVQSLAQQVGDLAAPEIDKWIEGLRERLTKAGSFAEAQRQLLEVQGEMKLEPLSTFARKKALPILPDGKPDSFYLTAFLSRFGLKTGEARLHRDKSGQVIPISAALFEDAAGLAKIKKRGRHLAMAALAEALLDPDEIWLNWEWHRGLKRWFLARRYLRLDADKGQLATFHNLGRYWRGTSELLPSDDIENLRTGVLLFRRGKLPYAGGE